MNETKRSIGNEQSLPIDIINEAILEYLETGNIKKDDLLLKIKSQNSGENRARKTCNAIYSLVTKSSALNKALKKNFTLETYYKLTDDEKNIIVMSLICLRFPFTYDLLFEMAKLFNVQDSVNKQYISEKMASIYGSNLSLEHGIDAALTIAMDCRFIQRIKPGLYSKNEPQNLCDFAKESWIYTLFEMKHRKSISISELQYEPIMMYLIDTDIDWKNLKILHTMIDYSSQLIIDKEKYGNLWMFGE